MKRIQTVGGVVILAAVFAVTACQKKDAAGSGQQNAGRGGAVTRGGMVRGGAGAGGGNQIFAVTNFKAEKTTISDYLALAGDIISGSAVVAYSDAAGKVTRVLVSVGSNVAKGQAIALVDPSKPGMTYVLHTVYSPISGTITALPAEVGMTISTATPLATISGGGGLEIQLFVPERYISKVRQGLACEIALDAWPGELFRGLVSEVSPTVDPVSRTEMIKVNVDNQGSRLKPGMFAKVNIVTEKKTDVIAVPAAAVVLRQGKSVLFVTSSAPAPADNGTQANKTGQGDKGTTTQTAQGAGTLVTIVHQVEVATGIQSGNMIEIVSGVSEGDLVVDKGMSLLTDGAKVNVIQPVDAGGGK